MFHKFINSNGTQEFLFMIAIAETLHILDRIWLPVKVEHTQADFSSSLFLFGSMLLMMKYISTIQDLKNSIQNMVLNAILFYAQVIATLIIWSVLHKWINAIFTNESIGYSCCLILSAALVYCGLTDVTWPGAIIQWNYKSNLEKTLSIALCSKAYAALRGMTIYIYIGSPQQNFLHWSLIKVCRYTKWRFPVYKYYYFLDFLSHSYTEALHCHCKMYHLYIHSLYNRLQWNSVFDSLYFNFYLSYIFSPIYKLNKCIL